jgi:hypothetical protein
VQGFPRSRETLQQLLQNESGREDSFPGRKGVAERDDMGLASGASRRNASDPDTGVDEQAQLRERPAL